MREIRRWLRDHLNVRGRHAPDPRMAIAEIADAVHRAGALLYLDGVHLTAHTSVDVAALGADFFVTSPYKWLGPHCGALAAAPELLETVHPDKLAPSPDAVPERFELGTLPYELLAGCTAAVDFIAGLARLDGLGGLGGLDGTPGLSRRADLVAALGRIEEHEQRLQQRIEAGLSSLDGVVIHSRAKLRTPTLLVSFEAGPASDVQLFLAERGVNAPAGSFYALEPSRRLGLGAHGALRIGLAPYTNGDDVDRLLAGITEAVRPRS